MRVMMFADTILTKHTITLISKTTYSDALSTSGAIKTTNIFEVFVSVGIEWRVIACITSNVFVSVGIEWHVIACITSNVFINAIFQYCFF